ncbi:hypothetical protein [Salinimicrobium sp. HB62]|uniref:hypothetical protein n=1 Tax=Salinimicrobium sp. HB62 TaxID=3077781 RepID=UPI002D7945BF|nr:hypothetical protein [Salinimicrobium sp. HB62]
MRISIFFCGLFVLLIIPVELSGQPQIPDQTDVLQTEVQQRGIYNQINEIYEMLQERNYTLKDVQSLTPEINWDQILLPEGMTSRNHISLSGMLRNEWMSIVIKNLQFWTGDKKSVRVTGIINGRQPSECEFISYNFEHHWVLEDERIVGFRE